MTSPNDILSPIFDWINRVETNELVALVGLASIVITALSNMFPALLRMYFSRLKKPTHAAQVFATYADPIALATADLFWRLREVLVEERSDFLTRRTATAKNETYNYQSTLFRLAALLGWLRAYQLELHHFSLNDSTGVKSLRTNINRLQDALSNGVAIEHRRIMSVFSLCEIAPPAKTETLHLLGAKLSSAYKRYQLQLQTTESNSQESIDAANRNLSEEIYELIRDYESYPKIENRIDQIVKELDITEEWLNRDYQAGIGDMMICETSGGARRFDVIGYGEFEELTKSGQENTKKWMHRLQAIFRDLDTSASQSDARVQMLEDVLQTIATLLLSVSKLDDHRSIVEKSTVRRARHIQYCTNWRKTCPGPALIENSLRSQIRSRVIAGILCRNMEPSSVS